MKRSFISLLLALTGLLLGAEARAEAFIDVYGGGAFTSDMRSETIMAPQFFNPVGDEPPDGPPNIVLRGMSVDASFADSTTYGGRVGYWFGKWAGLAVDAFRFEADVDAEDFTRGGDVRAIPISALLMLRWPLLTNEEYPLGRIHPYIGGGPSLFLTKFDGYVDLVGFDFPVVGDPIHPTVYVEPAGDFSSKNVDPGMELLVGLNFQILPFLGVFGEYRYTLAEPVWSDTVPASVDYPGVTTDFAVPLRTHHIVGGLSFRF